MRRLLLIETLIVVVFIVSASEHPGQPFPLHSNFYPPVSPYQSRPHYGGTTSEHQQYQWERMRQNQDQFRPRNQTNQDSWYRGHPHRQGFFIGRQPDPRDRSHYRTQSHTPVYTGPYTAPTRARRKRPENDQHRRRNRNKNYFQSESHNMHNQRIRNRNPDARGNRNKSSRNNQNRNNPFRNRYPNPYYHQNNHERRDEYEDLSTTTEIVTSTTTQEPFDVNDIKVPTEFLRIEYMISFTFLGLMYGLGFLVLFQSLCVPVAKIVVTIVYLVLTKLGIVRRYTIQDALGQVPPN